MGQGRVGLQGGAERGGCGGERGGRAGREGGGEAGRVEERGLGRRLVDDAEGGEGVQDRELVLGEGRRRIGQAQLERGDEEDEGEHFDLVHGESLGIFHVEEEKGPDLGVDVFEDKGKTVVGDVGGVATRGRPVQLDQISRTK